MCHRVLWLIHEENLENSPISVTFQPQPVPHIPTSHSFLPVLLVTLVITSFLVITSSAQIPKSLHVYHFPNQLFKEIVL